VTQLSFLTSVALPIVLIALVFSLPWVRKKLDVWVKHSQERSELIDEYHANAMIFLKNTDPNAHAELREVVVSMGDAMMDGAKLIRLVLFSRALNGRADDTGSEAVAEGVAALSDTAQHAMAHAMGSALIVSSLNAVFLGSFYRSALMLVLKSREDRELREPAQIVYRYSRAEPRWTTKPTAC